MQEMVRKDLTEGIIAYEKDLTKEVIQKKSVLDGAACELECGLLKTLDGASAGISGALKKLYEKKKKAEGMEDLLGQASFYQETILKDMDELRKYADEAEAVIPDEYLSYPTYGQMLFSLR